MHTVINAVILRYTCKATPLLSLYTASHGRITVRDCRRNIHRSPLHVGDSIEGHIQQFGSTWQLSAAEQVIIKQQDQHDPHSLFWKHHLLDLYYCYVPLEQPSVDLFQLLSIMMRLESAPALIWKAALVHLFGQLGYGVPAELQNCLKVIIQIDEYAQTYNTANVLHIDSQKEYVWDEQAADAWLVKMMQQHAHYSLLQTHYLFGQLYGIAGSAKP